MPSIIPFAPGIPEQPITITLDGESYVLRARWNTWDAAWYLDAWERDGTTPIAFGVKLVLGTKLGGDIDHPLFLGGMVLIDNAGTGEDPQFSDLGTRCLLVHMTVGDAVLSSLPPS